MSVLANLLLPEGVTLSPEAQLLWRKYHLTLKPKFYMALLVLCSLAFLRGESLAIGIPPGLYFLFPFSVLALVAHHFSHKWFLWVDNLVALPILGTLLWQYFFAWPLGLPAPVLVLFPLVIVLLASADLMRWATLVCLLTLGLVVIAVVATPTIDQSLLLLAVALGITPVMLYLLSLVLWLREIRLFNRRSAVLSAIRASINMRDGLLKDFWQRLTIPLESLMTHLQKPQVDWQQVCDLSDRLHDELAQASRKTMELESKLYYPPNTLENELELLGRSIMKTLINCAAIVTGLILVIYVVAGAPIRASLIGAVLFSLLLYASAEAISASLNRRRSALYGFFVFLIWGCVNQLMVAGPLYDLLYGLIFVYCAFNAATLKDAIILTAASYVLLALWFVRSDSPPLAEFVLRGNFFLALTFTVALSAIRLHWFRRFLGEVGEQERALQRERELRHRLMATLFHDLANPLHVIVGHSWLGSRDQANPAHAQLMYKMGKKISNLLEVTRALGGSEDGSLSLNLESVMVGDVLQDLQETFGDRMKAKQLKLQVEPSIARVRVHPTVLGLSVLSNLLTNAIKFSPSHGTITITTTLGTGDRQGMLGIHITDEGEGIPAAVIDSIRENLPVVSTAGTAGESGHGQGLRLAAMYLEKMQGSLQFGRGSTVTAYVQLAS